MKYWPNMKSYNKRKQSDLGEQGPYPVKQILIFIFILFPNVVFAKSFHGTWEVKNISHHHMTSISRSDAESFIGVSLELSDLVSSSSEGSCVEPVYEIESFSNTQFFSYYKSEFSDIKLKGSSVKHIMVLCNDRAWNKFGHIFLYTPSDRIVVIYDGYYFNLQRTTLNQASKKTQNKSSAF
jgi:hypothetical protein